MSTPTPDLEPTPTVSRADSAGPSTPLATTKAADQASDIATPTLGRFGPYELLEEIERGGMGVVYKARQAGLDRVVALKMILAGPAAQREEVLRFQREARAAGRLRHVNIIAVHDVGIQNGYHYFTMPLARSGSLAQHAQRISADPKRAAALVEKVARAVQHAHDHGILHRDLKPSNVLLDEGDEPWVADFGLAKILDCDDLQTRTGREMGTPAYMAPEQSDPGLGPTGPAADVWALGVILYELLAGRRPFRGRRETMLHRIHAEEPRPLSRERPAIDADLGAVVLKCLNKEASKRYLSAGALADDLARWQRGEPTLARPEGWLGRSIRRLRRHRSALLAGLALCLLLGGAVLVGAKLAGHPAAGPLGTLPDEYPAAFRAGLDRLDQGEPLELVGDTGGPLWYRWPLEAGRVALVAEPDQPLGVKTVNFTPLELVPAAPPPCYRLEAEVWQTLNAGQGEAGLFIAHDLLPQGDRPNHFFCLYGLSDKGANAGRLALTRCRCSEPGTKLVGAVLTARQAAGADPWRRLAVDVTADGLTLWLDGAEVRRVPYADVNARTSALLQSQLPAPVPAVNPRGALGLYVIGGAASFRRVVVRSLP